MTKPYLGKITYIEVTLASNPCLDLGMFPGRVLRYISDRKMQMGPKFYIPKKSKYSKTGAPKRPAAQNKTSNKSFFIPIKKQVDLRQFVIPSFFF